MDGNLRSCHHIGPASLHLASHQVLLPITRSMSVSITSWNLGAYQNLKGLQIILCVYVTVTQRTH